MHHIFMFRLNFAGICFICSISNQWGGYRYRLELGNKKPNDPLNEATRCLYVCGFCTWETLGFPSPDHSIFGFFFFSSIVLQKSCPARQKYRRVLYTKHLHDLKGKYSTTNSSIKLWNYGVNYIVLSHRGIFY